MSKSVQKFALTAILFVAAATSQAFADSSPWTTMDGGKVRLIAMPSSDGKALQAGLQVVLNEGWKTYWRSPGTSGIPPQVSFLGSQNLVDAKLRFPTPNTIKDIYGTSAGYEKSVTFPIDFKLVQPGQPTTIKANGVLGVCGEICVPVQFSLALTSRGATGSTFDVIAALNEGTSNLPDPASDMHQINEVRFNREQASLTIKTTVPAGTKEAELFLDAPYNWYLSPVKSVSIDGTTATFNVSLASLPKKAKPQKTRLKAVLRADGKGVFQNDIPIL